MNLCDVPSLVYLVYVLPILLALHLMAPPQTPPPSSAHSLSMVLPPNLVLPSHQPITFLFPMRATHLHSVQKDYSTVINYQLVIIENTHSLHN